MKNMATSSLRRLIAGQEKDRSEQRIGVLKPVTTALHL